MINRKKLLLRWYKINIQIQKQKLSPQRKNINTFWIRWEKLQLFKQRLIQCKMTK